ncbi:hypothetical protein PQR62_17350 [Herbaspirillum lusitanum]|uniref:Uncharacterized protein n=1 Tax=Herbaspirillum lusitanum TaxID=213312 RepID=A0ABW9ADS5_9BURK
MEWSAWQYRGIPEIQLSWHFLQQRRVDGGIAELRIGSPGVDSKRRVSALKVGTILPTRVLAEAGSKTISMEIVSNRRNSRLARRKKNSQGGMPFSQELNGIFL